MNTIDNEVLNKNILKVKYDGFTPYFEIQVEPSLFIKFQTDHRLELDTSFLPDSSLKITMRLKTFRSTVNFNVVLPSWDKHDPTIRNFLSSFVSLEKVQIQIKSLYQNQFHKKFTSIPSSVREACKVYMGELLTFQPNDGLEETFRELPVGFLVPYANPSYFLLLCKIEDALFEKIKWVSPDTVQFKVWSTDNSINLSMFYQGVVFALLHIDKKDVCHDISDDFQVLLTHQKMSFAITNQSMSHQQYLHFSKDLTKEQLEKIQAFFFSDFRFSQQL